MSIKKWGRRLLTIAVLILLSSQTSLPGLAQTHHAAGPNTQYIFFAPSNSNMSYLVDMNGTLIHTWPGSYLPGEAAYLLPDGSILRSEKISYQYAGAGGGIQHISWNGTVLWDYRFMNDSVLSHHDFRLLPNGNVLLIAWEFKTGDEALAAGRDPNHLGTDTILSEELVEIKPIGASGGDIVWSWHVWDHLVQHYDSGKPNYGVVADHPELIDLNYGSPYSDWLHINSVEYNATYDQILLSCRLFNEIWVIDHSTTTAEAAGHTGGRYGHGGDLLYRWGNPQTYQRGTAADQKFFGQHDATWIGSDCPGTGDFLIFNNGVGRPGGQYATVEQIHPPRNPDGSYTLEPNASYGPQAQSWITTLNDSPLIMGGAQRLRNGNTLICLLGDLTQVTPDQQVVWSYDNPYPTPTMNGMFKCRCYYGFQVPGNSPDLACNGSLDWRWIHPGDTVTGSFQVRNIGGATSSLNWTINTSDLNWGTWTFTPNSGSDLEPGDGPVTVNVTVTAGHDTWKWFRGTLRVQDQNNPTDYAVIPIRISTSLPGPHHPILEFIYNLLHHMWTIHW